ncbi:MAG: N-acetylmuramoyl-L-alanine amidase [Oscillospiraceae bacterium]|nr:N-acetylmuramoyl-L-alanine amidase [Oscillospiraceae bacterium]MBQ7816659.1 N-acetylmuramoyl-L-alanine amidase [Oscillospiraceae bacterium]
MAIKIYIDQGHNPYGFNSGAEGNGLKEQDITYNVGIYLAEILRRDDRFEVLTSRTCITQVVGFNNNSSLAERVGLANRWGADWFLSIHCNSSTNPNASGSEVYVYRSRSVAWYMAGEILQQITRQLGLRDRGVKINPAFYVLRNTRMPAMLIELAFITNPSDAQKLANDQRLFAQAIYDGIVNYLF